MVLGELKPHSYRPVVFRLKGRFQQTIRPLFQAGRSARTAGKFGVSMTDLRSATPSNNDNTTLTEASYHRMPRRIRGLE
jgi:hypothetical protein